MDGGGRTPAGSWGQSLTILDKHYPHPTNDNLVKIREGTNITNREEVE